VNHLGREKSPYLLQHAGNPVNWYPWGEEAFEAARKNDKPVFLSIGYSTCHWCHVMENESFSDQGVADLMNEAFISIKVDREERPDLDDHFMDVSRLLTGTGGWPLTIFMTAERKAFYAATYIPRENAYGRMGMLELIPRIRDLWENRRQEVAQSAEAIAVELARMDHGGAAGFAAGAGMATVAARALAAMFDGRNGGFGSAPKFPMPTIFGLLLRAWKRDGNPETLGMVTRTLSAMRSGGIYDQVGFGFHRYSTDAHWRVPHFEKMLYDQALHCLAYTEAWQATGTQAWKETAGEICAYVLRDLALPDGAFATAEDADSEGVEGRFYLWTDSEVRSLLGNRAEAFFARYRLEDGILYRDASEDAPAGVDEAVLLSARAARVRPLRDDKILADWNGLMIAALAKAGSAFGEPSYVAAAEAAARFVTGRMRSADGGILHRHRDGESAIEGFADDYAFVAWGLLELYEATFDQTWLEECTRLADHFVAHFWDRVSGGFFSAMGDEVSRRTPFTDGVLPSANSVGVLLLLKLSRITGRLDYQQKAEKLLGLYPENAAEQAISFSFFLSAADFAAGPDFEIMVAGDRDSPDTLAMIRTLRRGFFPNAVISLKSRQGTAMVSVCRDTTCSLPTGDVQAVFRELR
jgi:hypothetical protein